jgi:hypothetical protein
LPAPDQSRLMRWLAPVGRSPLAIAAGYAGLFAVIIPLAPIALVLGILAIRDVRRNKRHGMGRAIFGVVTGGIGTILLAILLLAIPFGGPSTSGGVSDEAASSVIDRYVAHEAGVTAGKEHGFSAVFPEAPIKDVQKGVAGQSVDTHIYSSSVDATTFQVAFSDAEFALDSSLPNLILRDAADGGAAIVGGKVTGYRRFTVDGDPAAAFVVAVPDGTFSRARVILHGNRLYFLGVASNSSNPRGFGRFVDSFRIL